MKALFADYEIGSPELAVAETSYRHLAAEAEKANKRYLREWASFVGGFKVFWPSLCSDPKVYRATFLNNRERPFAWTRAPLRRGLFT